MKNETIKLTLDDCRRITGKSLLWEKTGSVLDAFVSGIDKQQVVEQWLVNVQQLQQEVNWSDEATCYRLFEDGISLAISAPMDALYASCELNEAAWILTCKHFSVDIENIENPELVQMSYPELVNKINLSIAEEANPQLMSLMCQAKQQNAPYLVDDDDFSLGYGVTAKTWSVFDLPNPETINWQQYQAVPLALVTGTNGKSTSVRIMSQIIKASGKCCGVTSTDFIRVGEKIIDYGDYSGPGGARMLLRHPDTEFAILEVARGGILRRGLPIDNVDAALITNIAEDHLGQYGINTVEALAKAKAVVAKALTTGTLVLNADDHYLVALAPSLDLKICWFSLDEQNPVLQQHKDNSGAICFNRDGVLTYTNNQGYESDIVHINDIPMTLNGAAKHNIQNALGAIGLAKSLNIDNKSIVQALTAFSSNIDDNPGRGNQFAIKGAKVVMDFAHNAHSMDAMANTSANIPAKRKFLMLSLAGDRSDQEVINMTKSALKMQPDVLVTAELESYLRGREIGDIPSLMAKTAIENGMSAENILYAEGPLAGTKKILEQLQPDDLALLLVLSERNNVIELLQSS
ncbi:MAG: Mur ligase family protein [Psychromonas sp.]